MFPRTDREDRPAGDMGVTLPGTGVRPVVTLTLLAAIVALWVAVQLSGGSNDHDVLLAFGAMEAHRLAAGEYWRLGAAMFLHMGLLHLGLNCVGLLIFGYQLEPLLGRVRYIVLYAIAGLGGSGASYAFNISVSTGVIAVGASGAIFGVLGGLVAFLTLHRDRLGRMGRQNLTGLLVLAAINLAFGLVVANVDNYAHAGGFVTGLLVGFAYSPNYRPVYNMFGGLDSMADSNSILRRWWVVPAAAIVLCAGILWGNHNVGRSAFAQVIAAERHRLDEDFAEAVEALDRAIEIEPRLAYAYLERGRLMMEMGNTRRAMADLGTALRLQLPPEEQREALQLLVRLRSGR